MLVVHPQRCSVKKIIAHFRNVIDIQQHSLASLTLSSEIKECVCGHTCQTKYPSNLLILMNLSMRADNISLIRTICVKDEKESSIIQRLFILINRIHVN